MSMDELRRDGGAVQRNWIRRSRCSGWGARPGADGGRPFSTPAARVGLVTFATAVALMLAMQLVARASGQPYRGSSSCRRSSRDRLRGAGSLDAGGITGRRLPYAPAIPST